MGEKEQIAAIEKFDRETKITRLVFKKFRELDPSSRLRLLSRLIDAFGESDEA